MNRLPAQSRDTVTSGVGLPQVAAGLLVGALEIPFAASFSTLIFGPVGADAVTAGVAFILAGVVVVLVATSLFSSLRGSIGSAQDMPAAILGVVAVGVVARAAPDTAMASVVAAVMLTGVLTGAALFLLGALRLGHLARFLPFPVVAGFLAGTGWLLLAGGVTTATGAEVDLLSPAGWTLGPRPGVLAAGLIAGTVLLLVSRRASSPWALAGAVGATVGVVHLAIAVTGLGVDGAVTAGWLMDTPAGAGRFGFALGSVPSADWSAVFSQLPSILSVVVLAPVALLLNVTGDELACHDDADLDHELRLNGAANIGVGLLAGVPGYNSLYIGTLARTVGGRRREIGLIAGAVVAAALVVGPGVLRLMPTPLVVGVLVFLGVDFLWDWAVTTRRRLPAAEHAVIVLIVAVIAAFGFLQGIVAGTAAAIVIFVVSYARGDVVRFSAAGDAYQSRADRSPEDHQILRIAGGEIHVVELQGFVFFGTAHRILERLRTRIHEADVPPLRSVVVDLRRVSGVDSSAVVSLERVHQMLVGAGAELLLSGVADDLRARLVAGGIGDETPVRMFAEMDRAVQQCEDDLLSRHRSRQERAARTVDDLLRDELGPEHAAELDRVLEHRRVAMGTDLLVAGDVADELFLLVSGSLTVVATSDLGTRLRLRTFLPGALVGEVGLLLGEARTATVVADVDSEVRVLRREVLVELGHRRPDVAAAVHEMLARELAGRLRDSVRMIEALLD